MKKKVNTQGNKRSREFSLIVYMSSTELRNCIASLQLYHNLKHFAFIMHDKDKKEDGTPKEPHYHLYLYFTNARELKGTYWLIKSYTKSNVMIEAVRDRYTLVNEYFIHKDNPEKYQYNKDEIIMDDEGFFRGTKEENRTVELLQDIINGTSLLEMATKYGRDYIINRERYESYARELKKELGMDNGFEEIAIGGDK